jgi:uncharacterized protein YkwD
MPTSLAAPRRPLLHRLPSAATAADPRDGELKSMCRQINSLRVQNGVAPLLISTTLRTAPAG